MPNNIGPEKSCSTGAAAALLGIPRRTVTKYCIEGKISATQNKISKRWTIRQSDLVEFMKQHGLTPHKHSPSPRILIIDDDSAVVKTISKILLKTGWGISVDSAFDGFEALIKIGEEMPDLIFLDIQMPRVDGKDILTAIKKGSTTNKIKIIVVTGYPDKIEEMLSLGADRGLVKPFTINQIIDGVSQLLPGIKPGQ